MLEIQQALDAISLRENILQDSFSHGEISEDRLHNDQTLVALKKHLLNLQLRLNAHGSP